MKRKIKDGGTEKETKTMKGAMLYRPKMKLLKWVDVKRNRTHCMKTWMKNVNKFFSWFPLNLNNDHLDGQTLFALSVSVSVIVWLSRLYFKFTSKFEGFSFYKLRSIRLSMSIVWYFSSNSRISLYWEKYIAGKIYCCKYA